jgi:general secretion pathway protein B
MSFILDALKKSEAERRQGEAPRLQDGPGYPPPRRRRPFWPLLLTLALLLNGVVLGWWLLVREEPPATGATPAGEAAQVPAGRPAAGPSPAGMPAPAPAEPSTPAVEGVLAEAPSPAAAESPPGPPAAPARPQVAAETPVVDAFPPLSELPGNVRSGLPDLDLQLHFFTPEPERRMVRLNGHNLREGGVSGEGLSVVAITPDGVKLAYGGVRFFLPTARR